MARPPTYLIKLQSPSDDLVHDLKSISGVWYKTVNSLLGVPWTAFTFIRDLLSQSGIKYQVIKEPKFPSPINLETITETGVLRSQIVDLGNKDPLTAALKHQLAAIQSVGHLPGGMLWHPTGCHAKGQLLPLIDGSFRKVEDVVVGDQLMGHGTGGREPRTVLELHRGVDQMFQINPLNPNFHPFTVNEGHTLTLALFPDLLKSRYQTNLQSLELQDICLHDFQLLPQLLKESLWLCQIDPDGYRRYSFFSVEEKGEGDYYGFTVDGDNRYLLDDFTITRNSGKTFSAILWSAISPVCRTLVVTKASARYQWARELRRFTQKSVLVLPGVLKPAVDGQIYQSGIELASTPEVCTKKQAMGLVIPRTVASIAKCASTHPETMNDHPVPRVMTAIDSEGLHLATVEEVRRHRFSDGKIKGYSFKLGPVQVDEMFYVVVGWETLMLHEQTLMAIAEGKFRVIWDESQMGRSSKVWEVADELTVIEQSLIKKEKTEDFVDPFPDCPSVSESEFQELATIANQQLDISKPVFQKKKNVVGLASTLAEKADKRLAISATALSNLPRDLWGQANLVEPGGFGPFSRFGDRYCAAHINDWGGRDTKGLSNVEELKARLEMLTHYVSYQEANGNLPPKRREIVFVQPEEQDDVSHLTKSEYAEAAKNGSSSLVQAKLLLAAARKRSFILARVLEASKSRQKIVVLTGRRKDSERLHQALIKEKGLKDLVKIWHAHGDKSVEERNEIQTEFMAWNREKLGSCILVGTYDAWGTALSLHDTDFVIAGMLPYTPAQVQQMEGRFQRQGMTCSVLICYAIAAETYDEKVCEILLSKLPAVEEITGADDVDGFDRGLMYGGETEEQILSQLVAGLSKQTEEEDPW